jgi:DNA invertase Pin-like site-specific DNA recombinase
MIRCALYARVSTSDQNCEMQLRELREYVSRRGHDWKIVAEYVDSGFSGRKASRPSLDRLMADAAKRRYDAVLCYKIDRMGRSVLHLSQTLAVLDSHGVRFIATSQGLDTDAANPTSRLLLNILSAVAAFEVELIKERTLSGIKAARAKGKTLGRPMKIFRRDQVLKLRDEDGFSWRQIGERLNVPAMTAYNSYHAYRTKIVPETDAVTVAKIGKIKAAVRP